MGEEQDALRQWPHRPIGVLDSGVGGLSVVRHLRQELPAEHILYFADQAHIPYGPRPPQEVRAFTAGISRFLMERGAKLIVVACNAATAAALDSLREVFPEVPFVGMEPAVKPAAAQTRSGKVGVLATPGTLNSHRYARLMARYGEGIEIYEDPCIGLVQLIEAGALEAPETRDLLQRVTGPMLESGVDTFVLGCTHYPFVAPLLRQIAGDDVAIIDPAPAVARRTRTVLQQQGLAAPDSQEGTLRCYTSGDARQLAVLSALLLGRACHSHAALWQVDGLAVEP